MSVSQVETVAGWRVINRKPDNLAVIYARVSSKSQDKYSIESQIKLCREFATKHNYQIVAVYTDRGISAKDDNRPEFQKMIMHVLAGEADFILVYDFSRFSRNEEVSVTFKSKLRQKGKEVISITQPIDDTPMGRLMEGFTHTLDEFYRLNLRANTIRGMTEMARRGMWPQRPPLGYLRDSQSKLLYISKVGPFIKKGFQAFATGRWTIYDWAHTAKERGYHNNVGKYIGPNRWCEVFRKRFYLGEVHWRGEVYQGKHEPLVDETTFNRVQILLNNRNSGGAKKRHFYLLKGLLWSTVHQKGMHGNSVRSKGYKFYYYRATGKGSEHNVKAFEIEDQIIDLLKMITVNNPEVLQCPQDLRLALIVAPNVQTVYNNLAIDEPKKREFLYLVFKEHSIHVGPNGLERITQLKPGFKLGG